MRVESSKFGLCIVKMCRFHKVGSMPCVVTHVSHTVQLFNDAISLVVYLSQWPSQVGSSKVQCPLYLFCVFYSAGKLDVEGYRNTRRIQLRNACISIFIVCISDLNQTRHCRIRENINDHHIVKDLLGGCGGLADSPDTIGLQDAARLLKHLMRPRNRRAVGKSRGVVTEPSELQIVLFFRSELRRDLSANPLPTQSSGVVAAAIVDST